MEDRTTYQVNSDSVQIRESCLAPFSAPEYTPPTWQEVRALLQKHQITGSAAAAITGVNPRAVRKWQAPPEASSHTEIPYSAWRLLILSTGEVTASISIEDMAPSGWHETRKSADIDEAYCQGWNDCLSRVRQEIPSAFTNNN